MSKIICPFHPLWGYDIQSQWQSLAFYRLRRWGLQGFAQSYVKRLQGCHIWALCFYPVRSLMPVADFTDIDFFFLAGAHALFWVSKSIHYDLILLWYHVHKKKERNRWRCEGIVKGENWTFIKVYELFNQLGWGPFMNRFGSSDFKVWWGVTAQRTLRGWRSVGEWIRSSIGIISWWGVRDNSERDWAWWSSWSA